MTQTGGNPIGRAVLVAALAAAFTASPAATQVVHGRVTDAGTGAPVGYSVVLLLDANGARVADALTDTAGQFALRAPAPGRYALHAERLGFREITTPPFDLGAGETVERALRAAAVPTSLAAVRVMSGASQCKVRPAEGEAAALVWDQARKALEATRVAADNGVYVFTFARFERELDPVGERIAKERRWVVTGASRSPFVSAPADWLAAHGYTSRDRDSVTYYGPDATVLLSDSFAGAHCFRIAPDDDAHAGMVGLAFEPVRRKHVDVSGVLWLDAQTAELRTLDYAYTGLPASARRGRAGGRIEFRQLPGGAWIVDRWSIRIPKFGPPVALNASPALGPMVVPLVGVHETGATVEQVSAADGRPLGQAHR